MVSESPSHLRPRSARMSCRVASIRFPFPVSERLCHQFRRGPTQKLSRIGRTRLHALGYLRSSLPPTIQMSLVSSMEDMPLVYSVILTVVPCLRVLIISDGHYYNREEW